MLTYTIFLMPKVTKNGVYTRCIWMKWYLLIKLCYFFYWGNTQVMMPKGSWTKSDTVECYIHGYNPNKSRNHGKILLIIRQATLIRIIIIVIILDVWAPFSFDITRVFVVYLLFYVMLLIAKFECPSFRPVYVQCCLLR